MIALLLAFVAQSTATADQIEIPVQHRGLWSIDPKFCSEIGPATVLITARRVDFYERHGFIDLGQLNQVDDPPAFYGSVRWVETLHFSAGVIRIEQDAGRLYITESADPDAPRNNVAWSRCPA